MIIDWIRRLICAIYRPEPGFVAAPAIRYYEDPTPRPTLREYRDARSNPFGLHPTLEDEVPVDEPDLLAEVIELERRAEPLCVLDGGPVSFEERALAYIELIADMPVPTLYRRTVYQLLEESALEAARAGDDAPETRQLTLVRQFVADADANGLTLAGIDRLVDATATVQATA